jgi:hypothetical protein
MALDEFDNHPFENNFLIPIRKDDFEIAESRLEKLRHVDLFSSYQDGLGQILKLLGKEGSSKPEESEPDYPAEKTDKNLENKIVEIRTRTLTMKTILLLAANPKGTKSLRLQEEDREIRERLRVAGYGKIPIHSAVAARPKDIQQALLDYDPQIVHFSGHGVGEKGLAFEDETGNPKLIDAGALAELFGLFSDKIECVVLNACYSESQAKEIVKHIGYVVGMNVAIGDDAAIKFSVGFYTAIGSGKDYEFSYKMGCNAIRLEGIQEYLTPVLLKKTDQVPERYPKKNESENPAKNIDSDLKNKVAEIENLYENAAFQDAYKKFRELCSSYPTYRDQAVSFLASFSDLSNQIMQGIIPFEQQMIAKQQIGSRFMMCLKRFKEEYL